MPRRRVPAGALVAAVIVSACGGEGRSVTAPGVPVPAPTAAPTARYAVTFDSTWGRETHPTDFPADAHYSRLIGAAHSSRVSFWTEGASASVGIEAMAERGAVSPLDQEIEAGIAAGTASTLIRGLALDTSPGATSVEFDVVREHPLVTLVTMVAPSPDWFVGVHDLSLLEGGDWAAQKTVTLHALDAGTDSGRTYASPDRDTQPRQPIRRLEGYPVADGGSVAPFGTFTFRRLR
jgi:hypothetical protein